MVNVFLVLLAVREQTLAPVKLDIFLCKDTHRLDHLLVQPEIQEESPFRVYEVVYHAHRYLLQPHLRFENQTVQNVHRCWWHLSIITLAVQKMSPTQSCEKKGEKKEEMMTFQSY